MSAVCLSALFLPDIKNYLKSFEIMSVKPESTYHCEMEATESKTVF
ncbi:hypothetical protein GEOBRER4_n0926 [Citrifermentans bremense]|uniref:Uncharacterized protein n=1 Tax=Citrifermentans bremense TaxID=60035 RepID=A0A7R7FRY0_9BACT|nr:hypothetical protein GEOBRER4_n0926 [Citrifermentans bremense]